MASITPISSTFLPVTDLPVTETTIVAMQTEVVRDIASTLLSELKEAGGNANPMIFFPSLIKKYVTVKHQEDLTKLDTKVKELYDKTLGIVKGIILNPEMLPPSALSTFSPNFLIQAQFTKKLFDAINQFCGSDAREKFIGAFALKHIKILMENSTAVSAAETLPTTSSSAPSVTQSSSDQNNTNL